MKSKVPYLQWPNRHTSESDIRQRWGAPHWNPVWHTPHGQISLSLPIWNVNGRINEKTGKKKELNLEAGGDWPKSGQPYHQWPNRHTSERQRAAQRNPKYHTFSGQIGTPPSQTSGRDEERHNEIHCGILFTAKSTSLCLSEMLMLNWRTLRRERVRSLEAGGDWPKSGQPYHQGPNGHTSERGRRQHSEIQSAIPSVAKSAHLPVKHQAELKSATMKSMWHTLHGQIDLSLPVWNVSIEHAGCRWENGYVTSRQVATDRNPASHTTKGQIGTPRKEAEGGTPKSGVPYPQWPNRHTSNRGRRQHTEIRCTIPPTAKSAHLEQRQKAAHRNLKCHTLSGQIGTPRNPKTLRQVATDRNPASHATNGQMGTPPYL
jgi:hypothetical protein